ncbi:hypothetical protein KIN20_009144 [Parelaphostrongylus tenuis]|uniref:Uncharacterized protein n=1 Tax=Parelaphostrongylus tenuis TaxID=148309 RepID=A0AAD5MS75_PARTN|nr:hypothetical protein KIN20_009144 [Parelaphostrongylus tenuis]
MFATPVDLVQYPTRRAVIIARLAVFTTPAGQCCVGTLLTTQNMDLGKEVFSMAAASAYW